MADADAKAKRKHAKPVDEATIAAVIAKHFVPTCKVCPAQLHSLAQAIEHYRDQHQMDNGYLECCNRKFNKRAALVNHVRWHLNPNAFQ